MRLDFENPYLLLCVTLVPVAVMVLRFTLVDSLKLQLACSAFIRCTILALLALALAGTLWVTRSRDVSLLVMADLSDSVPESATNQVRSFLNQLKDRLSARAKAGLMSFAAAPQTLAPMASAPKFPDELRKPDAKSETAIERALVSAGQSMPSDTINRIALFSDGNETAGSALAAAKRQVAHGLKIFATPYLVPSEIKKGQSFTVSAVAHASSAATGTFTLYRDGFKIQEQKIGALHPGCRATAPGFVGIQPLQVRSEAGWMSRRGQWQLSRSRLRLYSSTRSTGFAHEIF